MRKAWEAILIVSVFFSVIVIFTLVDSGVTLLNLAGIAILIILVSTSLVVLSLNDGEE